MPPATPPAIFVAVVAVTEFPVHAAALSAFLTVGADSLVINPTLTAVKPLSNATLSLVRVTVVTPRVTELLAIVL
jgi:hypothetical protein